VHVIGSRDLGTAVYPGVQRMQLLNLGPGQVRAVDELDMPPTGTMVPLERAQLSEWLRCDVLPQIGEVQLSTTGGGSI